MRGLRGFLAATAVLVCVAGGASAAQAATVCPTGANTWTGNAHDGSWGTPGNWSLGNAPGTSSTTEDVCLPDSASPYTVTLAPFQYINSINNPPIAKIAANSLTVGSGASLTIHGASSNGNFSSSGGDVVSLALINGGSISAGGTLELLATDDNDGGGASDNGGRAQITGGTLTNAGTFTSVSQTTQGSDLNHQNELGISLNNLPVPGSSATVASGVLNIENGASVTNDSTFTVASGADTELVYANPFTDPPSAFINNGAYVNNGKTTVQPGGRGSPITWTQQGGSVSGNPIVLQNNAQLADAAGAGAFLFNNKAGELSGTVPAGQTVTVEADSYGTDAYLNTLTLSGSQVVNQGTLTLHTPNVSTDNQTAIRVTGAQLVNQGTINSVADVPNLANELDVSLQNAHGASLGVNGTLIAQAGGTVTNDGTISVAPGSQLQEFANPFTSGKETFTNAADGTIVPQIAGSSSFGSLELGGDSTVNLGGTVAPALVGGYTPAVGGAFATFPIATSNSPAINGAFATVSGGFTSDYSHRTTNPAYIGVVYGAPGGGGGTPSPSPSPAPTPAPTPPTSSPRPSTLGYGKASVKGSTVRVTLSCSAGSGCEKTTIRETIRVRARGRRILGIASRKAKSTKKVKIKVEVVGTRSLRLASGRHTTVTVSLNATGRRLLARFHHLRLAVTVATRGKVRRTFTPTVTQPKKHHKAKHHKAKHRKHA